MPEIEEEVIEQQPPSAEEALRAMLGGGGPPPARAPTEPPPTEVPAPVEGEMPPPVQEEVPPAPDQPPAPPAPPAPDQALLEQIAQLQAQISDLQGSMPSDQDKKILRIANGGEGNYQRYLAAKNTNLDAFSPLELLEMQFHEQYGDALKERPSDERRDIFHNIVKGKYNDYDPLDTENNFGLNPGQQFLMQQEADAYKSQRRKADEEFMLSFDSPQSQGPPPFTDEDHSSFRDMVADEFAKLKEVSAKDAQGNDYAISVADIPGFQDGMGEYLTKGPGEYVAGKFLGLDDQKRNIPNAKAVQQLAALEVALPHLLSKVAQQAGDKVRAELSEQNKEKLKSTVSDVLGASRPAGPPPSPTTAEGKLREILTAQQTSS